MKVINKTVPFILLLVANLFVCPKSFSQESIESESFIKHIQQTSDSSIVYYNWVALLLGQPKHYIISKQGDKFICSERRRQRSDYLYYNTDIDTTEYFNRALANNDYLKYWNIVMQYNPWLLKDDSDTTWKDTSGFSVDDGRALNLLLITKANIKHLSFDNPDIYEENVPGNINRQKVLKIEKIFEKVFQ